MKAKFAAYLLVFLLLLQTIPVGALNLSAGYACLMDAATGQILFEKNAHKSHSMASTTKIMTALLALEKVGEAETVTISPNAAGTEGSSMYLKAGETMPMSDLLYGLMLSSGNDAAIAIAEHVSGNVQTFAQMMTERAKELGVKNTSFKNPNGLDEEGHFTTAYDLALITRAALRNPRFAEICATKSKTIPATETSAARYLSNHNKLLSLYSGCIGVKTGFTKKTGRCLVSAAKRDHTTLICVTLNAPSDWNDHKTMLDYGFSISKAQPLVLKDMVLKSVPIKNGSTAALDVVAAEDFYLSFPNAIEFNNLKLSYLLPEHLSAPISAGTKIGRLTVHYEGETIGEMDLIAGTDVAYSEPPSPSFWENLGKFFKISLNFS